MSSTVVSLSFSGSVSISEDNHEVQGASVGKVASIAGRLFAGGVIAYSLFAPAVSYIATLAGYNKSTAENVDQVGVATALPNPVNIEEKVIQSASSEEVASATAALSEEVASATVAPNEEASSVTAALSEEVASAHVPAAKAPSPPSSSRVNVGNLRANLGDRIRFTPRPPRAQVARQTVASSPIVGVKVETVSPEPVQSSESKPLEHLTKGRPKVAGTRRPPTRRQKT